MAVVMFLGGFVWGLTGGFGWMYWWDKFTDGEVFEHPADVWGEYIMIAMMCLFGPISFLMGWMLFGRGNK